MAQWKIGERFSNWIREEDEQLECTALVITLERSSPLLGDLLHSLMYVGGSVVTHPPFQVDSAYVLVGMEI